MLLHLFKTSLKSRAMWVLWFHASRRYACNACPSTTGRPGSQIDSNMNRPWQPRQQLSWSLKSTRQTALKTSCKLLDQERRTSFCVKLRQSSIENVDQLTKPEIDGGWSNGLRCELEETSLVWRYAVKFTTKVASVFKCRNICGFISVNTLPGNIYYGLESDNRARIARPL